MIGRASVYMERQSEIRSGNADISNSISDIYINIWWYQKLFRDNINYYQKLKYQKLNAENVSIWWRHHDGSEVTLKDMGKNLISTNHEQCAWFLC